MVVPSIFFESINATSMHDHMGFIVLDAIHLLWKTARRSRMLLFFTKQFSDSPRARGASLEVVVRQLLNRCLGTQQSRGTITFTILR